MERLDISRAAKFRPFFLVALPAAIAFTLFACSGRQAGSREGPRPREIVEESGDGPGLPAGWFLRQRLKRGRSLPANARSAALRAALAKGLLTPAPGSWVNAGPVNIGGRVTALGLDPNNPNHFWLGSAEGGVFSSADGGVTWTPLFDQQTALSIGSLAVDPVNSSIAYVGTGEDNGGGLSYDGEGVFKTTNGGATWMSAGLGEVRRIGRIAVDPSNPQRVFVAAGGDWFNRDPHRGIYRSSDGGISWEKVLYVADDAGGIDVVIDPAGTGRIYAAIWQRQSLGSSWIIGGPNSGVYRSLDGGTTWTRLTSGLPTGGSVGRIGLAIARSNPNMVYALIINDQGGPLGLYRTANAGDSWTLVNGSLPLGDLGYYFGNVRVDPTDENVVYLLEVFLFKSADGGASFSIIGVGEHPDWHDLIIDGRRLLAGSDGGFFWSKNRGSSWSHAATLPISQIYDLGIDRLQPERRFAGTQDNGVLRTATGGASDWQIALSGDGLQCEVDGADSNVVYAERQYGSILRSNNGGTSFSPATTGIDPTERTNWNTPITLDPEIPATLYTGAQRVYRSTDSALSWVPISPDLTNGPGAGLDVSRNPRWRESHDHLQNLIEGTITVVSVSPVDSRILWAGTDDGNVWVTDDSGATWTKVNPQGPSYWITDIGGDPFDPSTAYLTVTGYRQGDRLPYLRITTDLGLTWQDLGSGLPQVPLNSITCDPAWRGRLFVGSDLGVHLSDDGGRSWSFLGGGMPYVVVLDLVLHDPSRTLYAGTHGRSAYAYDLGQLPPADGDEDGVDNNNDCALADPGAFAPPGEAGPVTVEAGPADSATLSWPSLAGLAGSATVYDVASGNLADLAANGTEGSASLACSLAGTMTSDPSVLPAGTGVYYLVRGRNVCAAGTWGTDSQAVGRVSSACP